MRCQRHRDRLHTRHCGDNPLGPRCAPLHSSWQFRQMGVSITNRTDWPSTTSARTRSRATSVPPSGKATVSKAASIASRVGSIGFSIPVLLNRCAWRTSGQGAICRRRPLLREMGNAQVSRPIDATAPFSGICCTCFTIPRCKTARISGSVQIYPNVSMTLAHSSIAASYIVHPQHSHILIRKRPKHSAKRLKVHRNGTYRRKSWHEPRSKPFLVAFFLRLSEAFVRRRVYNRTYAELNALSTRELDDLGISRSMISRLAYEAAFEN